MSRLFSARLLVASLAVPALVIPLGVTSASALSSTASAPASSAVTSAAGPAPAFTVVAGAAGDAAGLAPTVGAYRAVLGDPLNGSAPTQPSGRREINWDGVPEGQSAPGRLDPAFFNTVVPRGALFVNRGGFQVSAAAVNATGTPPRFGNINPQYDNIFATFSAEKLFTPLNSTTMRVLFRVPGTNTPAYVTGFGAVFTDVDLPTSSHITALDRHGRVLWAGFVPKGTKASKSLSFLGVHGQGLRIAEVRIRSGNAPLNRYHHDGGRRDIVVMDDFLYGEPKPLP